MNRITLTEYDGKWYGEHGNNWAWGDTMSQALEMLNNV